MPLSLFIPQDIRPPVTIKMFMEQFTDSLFKTTSFEFSPTPPRDASKGKGIMTLDEANAHMQEMQRLEFLKEEKEKTEKKLKVLTPAQRVKSKANDLLLKNLKAKFQWLKTQAEKLGVPPPPQLTAARVSGDEKKRKRTSKIIKEVFMSEYIVVDGKHRNLVPPLRVRGSIGLVISEPESEIFFYNGNFDLVFQREEEFHLATTTQLIRIQSAIQRDTPEGEVMFKKMELTIEARSDVTKARKIVKENLDVKGIVECKASASNLKRIQVKDIVKKVEDYLKTYSSVGMDISCKLNIASLSDV
ncbi:hypothetical protein Tco_0772804 [Tanacetum coccineum]|uniref:Uncharacterized protein n=1 Tax=Tanacetum coccineum TaxID=301880 RepID=A0ABQ4ZMS0_9ASTR